VTALAINDCILPSLRFPNANPWLYFQDSIFHGTSHSQCCRINMKEVTAFLNQEPAVGNVEASWSGADDVFHEWYTPYVLYLNALRNSRDRHKPSFSLILQSTSYLLHRRTCGLFQVCVYLNYISSARCANLSPHITVSARMQVCHCYTVYMWGEWN